MRERRSNTALAIVFWFTAVVCLTGLFGCRTKANTVYVPADNHIPAQSLPTAR